LRRPPAAAAAFLSIATVGAIAAWLVARSLQQDFAAYWIAGNARRAGLDPYLNQVGSDAASRLWDGIATFRHSRFLYPPLIAELFRPLAALPYRAAKMIFTAGMLAAWIGAGLLSWSGHRERTWFFMGSALFFPLYRHLERGQIDLLVLFFLVVAWRTRARPLLAGAALALGAAFKPALLGVLPVLWAGGRARAALAALATGAAIFGLTLAISGPARLGEYLWSVLPRAALYGEGGTDEMLLPATSFPASARDDGITNLDGRDYRTSVWDAPSVASIPRLLAPESPSIATSVLPFVLSILGLGWAARRLRGRGTDADSDADSRNRAEALLLFAAALACVVASPAGWVMGLVVAIPLAPHAAALVADARLSRRLAIALGVAWVAVALPAPFAGFPALAGAVLSALATAAALTTDRRQIPSGAT
jgi:Glycosyltransferase family 87